jgi:hypothetical protein
LLAEEEPVEGETLAGHVSPETGYVVDDYPYGFRLRTKIRYWLETKRGTGQRFCSQTLNPKTGQWNKPKCSTYGVIMVMVRQPNGHISTDRLSPGGYDKEDRIREFEAKHAAALGDYERGAIRYIRASNAANEKIKWRVSDPNEPSDPNWVSDPEKQRQVISRVIGHEYRKLKAGEKLSAAELPFDL